MYWSRPQAQRQYKGNPYLSSELSAALPTASDYYVVGQAQAGQPLPVAKERTDYWLVTAGLNGRISNLNWSVAYSHGNSTHTLANSGLYDNKKLYAALDAVVDPTSGRITCRVLLDPTVASQYAGCRPLNILNGDPSKATPDDYRYATGTSRYRAITRQDVVAANLSGSIFDLPAGPVDFAVGAEYRRQSLDLSSNANPALLVGSTPAQTTAVRAQYFAGLRGVPTSALFYSLTNVGEAEGSLNVKEVYGELAVPILADTMFFQELSVNGAVRVTDYSTSGTVTTWKGGVTWKPIDDVLFRGTYSRDIRAPNLFELFAGTQVNTVLLFDPKNAAGTYGSGLTSSVNGVASGNPDLQPEKAKTYTFGLVLTPKALPGVSLSVDYYKIKVDGLIDSLSAQQTTTACFNAGGSGSRECALIDRASPTSFPTQIRLRPINAAFLSTSGIDFDASYRTRLAEGDTLGVRPYASYLAKFDAQQYAGAPIAHYAGVSVVAANPVGYPRWRGNLSLDYSSQGGFGFTIGEQYIGGMRLDIPGGPLPIAFIDGHVKPVFYTDLSMRYVIPAMGSNFELFGTINNLTDKQPPIIPGLIPGANLPTNLSVYDVVGRTFTAGIRIKL